MKIFLSDRDYAQLKIKSDIWPSRTLNVGDDIRLLSPYSDMPHYLRKQFKSLKISRLYDEKLIGVEVVIKKIV